MSVPMKTARKASQTTTIHQSMYHTVSAYSLDCVPPRIYEAASTIISCQPQNTEPCKVSAPKPGRAGALHDIKGRHDQRIAPEGENHRRGMKRPQTAKVQDALGHGAKVQRRKGKLEGDDRTRQGNRPHPQKVVAITPARTTPSIYSFAG